MEAREKNTGIEDRALQNEVENVAPQNAGDINSGNWMETYEIWNYLKSNTALLIAAMSALIAIMSFVISVIAHTRDMIYLYYWGIDPLFVSIKNNVVIYCFVASIFLCFSTSWSSWYISSSFHSSRHYFSAVFGCQYAIKEAKNSSKARKELIEKLSSDPAFVEENALDIEEIENGDKETLRLVQELNILVRKVHKKEIKKLFLKLALTSVLLFLSLVFCGFYLNSTALRVFIMWLYAVSLNAIAIVANYLLLKRRVVRRLEQSEDNKMEYLKKIFRKIKKQKKKTYIHGLPNGAFLTLLVLLVSVICITAFAELPAARLSAQRIRKFRIYRDTQGVYAIIYQSDNKFIMEKASIREGNIIIDTLQQRAVISDDISYEKMKFDNVILLPNEEEVPQKNRFDIGESYSI